MKQIKFIKPYTNTIKVGDIFIKGLNGIPESYKLDKKEKSDNWWWRENTSLADNNFLYINSIKYFIKKKYAEIIKKLK